MTLFFHITYSPYIYILKFVGYSVIVLIAVLFVFLIFLLYKQIVLVYNKTFRPVEDYKFVIENLVDFRKHWVKLSVLLLLVVVVFYLKTLRKPYDIFILKHFVETIYYLKTEIPTVFLIYCLIVILLSLTLAGLCFLLFVYRLKMLLLRLHIWFLQIQKYVDIGFKLTALDVKYFMFFYNQIKKLCNNERLAHKGFYIYNITIFLESFLFKFGILLLYVFDILTNFGVITLTIQILPYYFLYNLVRKFLITWHTWFSDELYPRISTSLYDDPDKQQEIANVVAHFYNLYCYIKQMLLTLFVCIILLLPFLLIHKVINYSLS